MKQAVIESIERIAKERHYQRIIRRLVDALMLSFGIPDNDDLVDFLGHGHEKTNRDALASWVSIALQNPDYEMAITVLPHLVRRLERKLSELEYSQFA